MTQSDSFYSHLIKRLVQLLLHLLRTGLATPAAASSHAHPVQRLLGPLALLGDGGEVVLTQREQLTLLTLQPVFGLREQRLLLEETGSVLSSSLHRLEHLQEKTGDREDDTG